MRIPHHEHRAATHYRAADRIEHRGYGRTGGPGDAQPRRVLPFARRGRVWELLASSPGLTQGESPASRGGEPAGLCHKEVTAELTLGKNK